MCKVYNIERVRFETWDLTEINVPERSKLHSLEPIGVGTGLVESLTSYIGRIAESHNITTGVLLKSILGPQFNKKYLFEVKNQTKNPNSFRDYINNNGVIAREFVLAIEQLTLRNDLQYLTLVPWDGFTGNRRLLREFRAWCPKCLEENVRFGGELNEPLIWQFKMINKCQKHNVNLLTTCAFCKQRNGVLSQIHRVGYCQKCNKPLWLMPEELLEQPSSEWDEWIINNIRILLEKHMEIASRESNKMPELIKWLIHKSPASTVYYFAKYFRLREGAVYKWLAGATTPRFETLLKLSYFFNIPLFDLLYKQLDKLDDWDFNLEAIVQFELGSRRKVNREEIRLMLQNIIELNEVPPPSLSEVGRRINYPASIVYNHARDLAVQISGRYKEYRKRQRELKIASLIDEVHRITKELINEGIYPSLSRVQQRMTSNPRSSLIPEVREAHLEFLKKWELITKTDR